MNSVFDAAISPLLDLSDVPAFDQITADKIEPAIDHALQTCRDHIRQITGSDGSESFAEVVVPLENIGHSLERVWAPVSHLNAVRNNDDLRTAHNNCLEKLTQYWSEVGQNAELYESLKQIREQDKNLDDTQKRLLDLALIDFTLAGVALPEQERKQFADIKLKLSTLQSTFEENVLDCSNAWSFVTQDQDLLQGLPDNVLHRAAAEAQDRELEGWCFTLDFPTYNAILSHAENDSLRQRFYDAWVTRASTAGEHDAKYDNTAIIEEILMLRQQLAELIDFPNYAELSLARKMAVSGEEVEKFIRDLASQSREAAKREFQRLEEYAGKTLKPWDVTYYSERIRETEYQISDEQLRPYFPLQKALDGIFGIAQQVFAIRIKKIAVQHAWHEDVNLYEVSDQHGNRIGRFYTDLFARPKKRGGAWMAECIGHNGLQQNGGDAVAFLVCNFMPAAADTPPLLTHDEIVTLFHEFGHTLHMLLTTVPYPGIAGINGVPWDAVELPSQFMENFAWQEETLPLISGHFESGEAIPEDLYKRLLGTRTFNAGLQSLRQLEFALFDMRLHLEQKNGVPYDKIMKQVRDEIAVVPTSNNNRFANAFSHIFAGGYAAGYYSYKWAEVLSADAFAAFEESQILDEQTGQRFRQCILEKGGSIDALDAFKNFRGREPSLDALIRHNGLNVAE